MVTSGAGGHLHEGISTGKDREPFSATCECTSINKSLSLRCRYCVSREMDIRIPAEAVRNAGLRCLQAYGKLFADCPKHLVIGLDKELGRSYSLAPQVAPYVRALVLRHTS